MREFFTTDGTTTGDNDVQVGGAADTPSGGVWHPTLGALYCSGPTPTAAINFILDLPGLGRITLPVTVTEIP